MRDQLIERDFSAPSVTSVKLDDLSESGSEESQRSLSLVAATVTQDLLLEVLAAIRRIEKGTYGVCEVSGAPIETERLRAIPWTRHSLLGQKELEKEGTGRRHSLPSLQSVTAEELAPDEDAEAEEVAYSTVIALVPSERTSWVRYSQ